MAVIFILLLLPLSFHIVILFPAEPSRPSLIKEGIGNDHFNITFVPGTYDDDREAPVGNTFYVRYRETDANGGEESWISKEPANKSILQVWH